MPKLTTGKFNSEFRKKLMAFFDNKENKGSLTKDNIVHYYLRKRKITKVLSNKYNLNSLADSL